MAKSKRPPKIELSSLLYLTVKEIAAKYNVTRKTVRGWLKYYKLQTAFQKKMEHFKSNLEVQCKSCGKQFLKKTYEKSRTRNHFCSRSCSVSYNNSISAKRTRSWTTKKELIDRMGAKRASTYIRLLARDKCAIREQKCSICGYSTYVEVCHIKPYSNFDDDATECQINSDENLIILCPNHHKELDLGFLQI